MRYVEYTDETYSVKLDRPTKWTHLGVLGPLIRAEVGETIFVVFKNNASVALSVHPHGVFYTKPNEGSPDGTLDTGNRVMPGGDYVYEWFVPKRAGPGPSDGSSIMWMYHSHVDETLDTNSGLVGPMIITAKGASVSASELRPRDVNREFVMFLTLMSENDSHYLMDSLAKLSPPINSTASMLAVMSDSDFMSSNVKHCVNGYLFNNVPGLVMTRNERVRWYVFALGDEMDLHGAHWHGQTLLYDGHRCLNFIILFLSLQCIYHIS